MKDKIRTSQIRINKAIANDEVSRLFSKYYKTLEQQLVKNDYDYDILHDTYIKLTYNYDKSKDFLEQAIHWFYNIKTESKYSDICNQTLEIKEEILANEDSDLDFDIIDTEYEEETEKRSIFTKLVSQLIKNKERA